MDAVSNLSLLGATITTGIIAGLFFAYANSVMPALRGADDRAFVDVTQRINAVILNPLFLGTFLGGLVLSGAAAVAVGSADDRTGLPWIVAGVVLYAVMFAITRVVNIPLNVQLATAGAAGSNADLDAVRARFEARWTSWNLVRAVASAGAFCCLAAAALLR